MNKSTNEYLDQIVAEIQETNKRVADLYIQEILIKSGVEDYDTQFKRLRAWADAVFEIQYSPHMWTKKEPILKKIGIPHEKTREMIKKIAGLDIGPAPAQNNDEGLPNSSSKKDASETAENYSHSKSVEATVSSKPKPKKDYSSPMPETEINIYPRTIDFGKVSIGKSAVREITIKTANGIGGWVETTDNQFAAKPSRFGLWETKIEVLYSPQKTGKTRASLVVRNNSRTEKESIPIQGVGLGKLIQQKNNQKSKYKNPSQSSIKKHYKKNTILLGIVFFSLLIIVLCATTDFEDAGILLASAFFFFFLLGLFLMNREQK